MRPCQARRDASLAYLLHGHVQAHHHVSTCVSHHAMSHSEHGTTFARAELIANKHQSLSSKAACTVHATATQLRTALYLLAQKCAWNYDSVCPAQRTHCHRHTQSLLLTRRARDTAVPDCHVRKRCRHPALEESDPVWGESWVQYASQMRAFIKRYIRMLLEVRKKFLERETRNHVAAVFTSRCCTMRAWSHA